MNFFSRDKEEKGDIKNQIKKTISFNTMYIPAIILGFLLVIQFLGFHNIKYITGVIIPLATLPLLNQKFKEHKETLEKKDFIKMGGIFFLEIIICLEFLFKGFPTIPYFIAPFNNLYFYGIMFSFILRYYMITNAKKISKKKKRILYYFGGSIWFLILLYQHFI